jgi:aldose 1-epimerase
VTGPTPATGAASTFELRAGALRLAVRADLGGAIAGLWHGDMPVLRSTEPGALASVRDAGCFPLVPYSNRLGYRRFRWKGRDYTTASNFEGPHSIHGVGWMRPWEIVSSSALEVVLRLVHAGDADWPFAFEAWQYLALSPVGLRATLVCTNRDTIEQPVGLGFHPYFPKRARSRLHIELSQRWDLDVAHLPIRRVAQPGIDADVAHLDFDHCFEGWRGPARIRDEKLALQLTSSLPYLVVYTPRDAAHFCVEPVSHVSNAIHMADPIAHGLRSLAPGESMEASLALSVSVV